MIQNSSIKPVSLRISGLIKRETQPLDGSISQQDLFVALGQDSKSALGSTSIVGKLPYSVVWDYNFQKRTRTRERDWRRGLYAQVMMSISNRWGVFELEGC